MRELGCQEHQASCIVRYRAWFDIRPILRRTTSLLLDEGLEELLDGVGVNGDETEENDFERDARMGHCCHVCDDSKRSPATSSERIEDIGTLAVRCRDVVSGRKRDFKLEDIIDTEPERR